MLAFGIRNLNLPPIIKNTEHIGEGCTTQTSGKTQGQQHTKTPPLKKRTNLMERNRDKVKFLPLSLYNKIPSYTILDYIQVLVFGKLGQITSI